MAVMTYSDHALETGIKARVPVMLVGDPGTSKTATIRALADRIDYVLITIVPSRMDSQDISGFPTKGQYTYDDVVSPITEYAPQHWQMEIMKHKRVILFLDEFSNAHPSVRASLLSFIQDRQFPNGDKFPEETVIVGAMNPTDSAADGYELDPATTNRIMFLAWKPSVDSWLEGMVDDWGRGVESEGERKWRSLIARFISDEPGALHMLPGTGDTGTVYGINTADASEMSILQYAWASRRSWDNLSRILGALSTTDSGIEDLLMTGTVGYRAASQFRDWLRKHGTLNIASILKNPRKFDGWTSLSLDDLNLILRSAVDSIDANSNIKQILNVIEIFRIIAEIDRRSVAGPFLTDFASLRNRAKNLTADEKGIATEHLRTVIKDYREITARRK